MHFISWNHSRGSVTGTVAQYFQCLDLFFHESTSVMSLIFFKFGFESGEVFEKDYESAVSETALIQLSSR
jgi:hypothetical protein